MTEGTDWGGFFSGVFQGGIKTAVDYEIANHATGSGYKTPLGNQFTHVPELTPQPVNDQTSPSGKPLAFMYKSDGKLNPLVVGAGVLGLVLLLR